MKKTNIVVLCGGQSAEHEISIESAKNIVQALDKNRYEIRVIFITRGGEWILLDSITTLLNNPPLQSLPQPVAGKRILLQLGSAQPFTVLSDNKLQPLPVDAVFPALHGAHGEDGTLQGLLEIINIPYVGAGTLGAAACMDKEITKHLLRAADIPVAPWIIAHRRDIPQITFAVAVQQLGLPLFVKPANTGSSVGVSKVKDQQQFTQALNLAWQYDHKVILEQYIPGREIECAVLGNDVVEASLPGEIILHHEFYSYEAKYLDPNGATVQVPAELSPDMVQQVQSLAKKAFTALGCEGMARVDFFISPDQQVVVNEANTIPGFTQISMYPKMWIHSGMTYSGLIDKLIELALERFQRDRVLVSQADVAQRKGC